MMVRRGTLLLLASLLSAAQSQVRAPPYFNVALNRPIQATSTCGISADGKPVGEQYCQLTLTKEAEEPTCGVCDASHSDVWHPIEFAVDGGPQWWQSPPLTRGEAYHRVNITVSLGQEFHIAYVIVQAGNSPRPGHWILERSRDGVTYTPWQYFVERENDCKAFYGVSTNQVLTDQTVLCTAEYSKPVPLTNGQIFVSLVNGRPGVKTFSQSLQEWTSASHVRLRLLRVKTLKGELLTKNAYDDHSLSRRYYYSIKEIVVGGRCTCNGHSDECSEPQLQCVCQHNTCGPSCGECCEGYSQHKWRPRSFDNNFSCEKCNCYGHSSECVYNSTIDRFNLSLNLAGEYLGGGACQNCANHTTGINCERCRLGYFRTPRLTKQDSCLKCNCSGPGVVDGSCDGSDNGRCVCKQNVEGFYCDRCKSGFYGLTASNPTGCKPCACDKNGVMVGIAECSEEKTCPCKALTTTRTCGECIDGTFGLSANNVFGCRFCECYIGGSSQPFKCNKGKGKCQCHPGMEGKRCNLPVKGTCLPSFHRTMRFEVENGLFRSFKTPFAFNETEFPGYTSFGYVVLQAFPEELTSPGSSGFNNLFQDSIEITVSIPKDGKYRFVIRYILQSESDSKATISIRQTAVSSSVETQEISLSNEMYSSTGDFLMTAGSWHVLIAYNGRSRLLIDHVVLLPEVYYNPTTLHAVVSEMCSLRHESYLCREYAYPNLDSFPLKSVPDTIPSTVKLHEKPVLPVTTQGTTLVFESVAKDDIYVLIVSYFSRLTETRTLEVVTKSGDSVGIFDINLLPCMYRFGCRQVGVMASGNAGRFVVRGEVNVTIGGVVEDEALFIESVSLVPVSSWSPVLIRPALYCYQLMGSCIPTEFIPMSGVSAIHSLIGDDGYFFDSEGNRQNIPVSSNPELNHLAGSSRGPAKLSTEHQDLLVDITLNNPGDYYAVIHYYNPEYSSVYISVDLNGVDWQLNLPFCPDKSGCRVTTTSHSLFDDPKSLFVHLHESKTLYIYSISLLDTNKTRDYTTPLPVNLNLRFINECSSNGFLVTSLRSPFCQVSAHSLSAHYHQGSINCLCHPNGSQTATQCNENTCECQCKDNIVGDHCTQCKVGFYGFPDCRPCECSDGSVCDEMTGQCVCAPNVRGKNCDRCVSRYWGFHAVRGCVPCGCNPLTSERPTCRRYTGRCTCKANFTGRTCDECIAGKYDPPSCRDCGCFLKGSVGVACDQLTGQCQCKTNMDGRVCDRCRIGAFNFSESNPDGCQLCNCVPLGSVDSSCDQINGQCVCKSNIIGLKCDQCAPNTFQIGDGSCELCNCHPEGSRSESCDVRTGKCPCRKFVRGKQCARCLRGYYDLGLTGCKPCECSEFGSLGTHCHALTGRCDCKGSTFGRKCDTCAPRHVIGEDGCKACGLCTNILMDEIEDLFHMLNDTLLNVSDYSILVTAWKKLNRLVDRYNSTSHELSVLLKALDVIITQVGNDSDLFMRLQRLQEDADRLEPRVNSTTKHSVELELNTTQTAHKVDTLLRHTIVIRDKLNQVIQKLRQIVMHLEQRHENNSVIISEGIRIMNGIENRDFHKAARKADSVLTDSVKTRSIVEGTLNNTRTSIARANELQMTLSLKIKLLEEVKNLAENASISIDTTREVVTTVDGKLNNLMSRLAELGANASDVNTTISKAWLLVEKAARFTRNATATSDRAAEAKIDMEEYQLGVLRFVYKYRRNVSYVGPLVSLALRRAHRVSHDSKSLKKMYDDVWNEAKGPLDRYREMEFLNVTEIDFNVTQRLNGTVHINSSILDKAIASLNRSRTLLQKGRTKESELTENRDLLDTISSDDSRLREEHVTHRNTVNSTQRIIRRVNNGVVSMEGSISVLESNVTALEGLGNETVRRLLDAKEKVGKAEDQLNGLLEDLRRAGVDNLRQRVKLLNSSFNDMTKRKNKIQKAFDKADKSLEALDTQIEQILANIELAKQHAKRVNVPGSMSGEQAVTVSPPDVVSQPLAHTTVAMNVRRDSDGGLLFYIGEATKVSGKRRRDVSSRDFVAIELQNGIPVLIMSVAEKLVRIRLTQQMGRNEWYRIGLSRLGKTARLELTQFSTSGPKVTSVISNSVEVSHDFLNIGRHGNIFLGGVPSEYNVPNDVTRDHFNGCIDNVLFNSRLVPMFSFTQADQKLIDVCGSNGTDRKIDSSTREGRFLTGLGYIALPNKVLSEAGGEFKLRIKNLRTYQLNGLLFYAHGDGGKFLSLEVRNGLLLAQFNNGGETVSITLKDISLAKGTGVIDLVHDQRTVAFNRPLVENPTKSSADSSVKGRVGFTSHAYFGGVPDNFTTPPGVVRQALRACIGSIDLYKSSRTTIKLKKEKLFVSGSRGYSLNQCPVETFSCAKFDGSGHVEMDYGGLVRANSSYVSVYPTTDTGVIAFDGSKDGYAYLALDGGRVEFVWKSVGDSVQRVRGGVVPVNEWSHIAVIVEDGEMVELRVNDQSNFSTESFRSSPGTNALYIGGVEPSISSAIPDPVLDSQYNGSLSELIANEINIDFARFRDISSTTIALSECAPFVPSTPPTLMSTSRPTEALPQRTCAATPDTLDDGFYFDGKDGSRLEFDHLNDEVIRNSFSIELELRTLSDDGVILFAGNKNLKSYVYLRLDGGKLEFGYSASGTSQSARSSKSVNKGKWHKVVISRNRAKGQLVVDGKLKNVKLRNPSKIFMPITTPFYVGGIPKEVKLNRLPDMDGVGAFQGCVRNLRFNDTNGNTITEKDWASSEHLGSTLTGKCYKKVEKAAGFDGEMYALAGESWNAPTPFEFTVTIRTTSSSGLLLSVGDKNRHVVVYINDTLVTLKAAKGKGTKFQAQVTSNASMCDGMWHQIKAVVDNMEVTLEVDGKNGEAVSIEGNRNNIVDSATVYIGGFPGKLNAKSRIVPVGNFVGCMMLEYVMDTHRILQEAINSDKLNLIECPVP